MLMSSRRRYPRDTSVELLRSATYTLPESVKVFLKRKASCFYSPTDYAQYKHEYGYSVDRDTWTEDSSHYDHGLVAEEIKSNPSKYILMLVA